MRSQTGSKGKRILMTVACLALGGLALLLWARLKLVTGVPRTAIAVPSATSTEQGAKAAPSR